MTPNDVITYFENLATNHTEVKSFHYGGVDRILDRLKNKIAYPAVWLVEPDFDYKDNGGLNKKYNTDLLVLTKPISDKDKDVDTAKFLGEEILNDLLQRIEFDIENEATDIEFDFNNISGGYKDNYSSDKDCGAYVEFNYSIPSESCVKKEKWLDLL